MPHDKNNRELKVGDRVMIEAVVESVYQTENDGYCNTSVRTVEPMFPTEHGTTITLNAKQVVLKED